MSIPDPRQLFALDRRAIAQAFDKASASYDAAAELQQRVRNELLSRLDELEVKPQRVLDLGAGTAHGSRALKQRFPKSLVVAAIVPRKEMVTPRKGFSAAVPTAFASTKVLPQLCAFQGWLLPRIPKLECPASAVSAATEVRERIVVAPQRSSPVKAVVVPV